MIWSVIQAFLWYLWGYESQSGKDGSKTYVKNHDWYRIGRGDDEKNKPCDAVKVYRRNHNETWGTRDREIYIFTYMHTQMFLHTCKHTYTHACHTHIHIERGEERWTKDISRAFTGGSCDILGGKTEGRNIYVGGTIKKILVRETEIQLWSHWV